MRDIASICPSWSTYFKEGMSLVRGKTTPSEGSAASSHRGCFPCLRVKRERERERGKEKVEYGSNRADIAQSTTGLRLSHILAFQRCPGLICRRDSSSFMMKAGVCPKPHDRDRNAANASENLPVSHIATPPASPSASLPASCLIRSNISALDNAASIERGSNNGGTTR